MHQQHGNRGTVAQYMQMTGSLHAPWRTGSARIKPPASWNDVDVAQDRHHRAAGEFACPAGSEKKGHPPCPDLQERIAMNPDIQLRHDVFAQLNWDPAVNACDVDVRVTNGVVTLVGRVADEAQRAAAERAARRTVGMTTLLNGLTVRPAAEIAR